MNNQLEKHFNQVKMDWLTTADDVYDLDTDTDDQHLTYPLPNGAGVATGNMLKTSHHISVYHAHHEYDPAYTGDKFIKGEFNGAFESNTLMVGAVFGSECIQSQRMPDCQITMNDNLTLFRHADRYEFESTFNTERSHDLTFFTLPIHSLNLLIGTENTDYLLSSLDITNAPSVVSRPVPIRITRILKSAISPHLRGRMKQHYSQVKVLEYLCELIEHIEQQNGLLTHGQKQITTIHDLHDYLSDLEGKLPSIVELAEQTGMSAQTLNQAFADEFGTTIHRFMTKKRLEEAHATIVETAAPLKVLAERLGYSHVNHFITAFKREFGYTPGSLRRG